jgi:hypothetical protein
MEVLMAVGNEIIYCGVITLYHGPGVDSAPSENEYQEHFLG